MIDGSVLYRSGLSCKIGGDCMSAYLSPFFVFDLEQDPDFTRL